MHFIIKSIASGGALGMSYANDVGTNFGKVKFIL